MLIAILLWFGCFQPNNQYTATELETHALAVEAILEDPQLEVAVWDSTGRHVPTVVIVYE